MIKPYYIILSIWGIIAFLTASCSPDEALLETNNDNQEQQTYTLYLDADVPCFEQGHEGETRASGSSWEDGDVIYISFKNNGSTVVSKATYKRSLGTFQFSSVSLDAISDEKCSVYYFRGGSVSEDGNTINMDKYTAIFCDYNAKYSCSSDIVTLSAALKPYTWRLCFMGEKGTQVKIKSSSTIHYVSSLNLFSGVLSTTSENVTLQIQSNGYSSYVYGQLDGWNNVIHIEVGSSNYFRDIDRYNLIVGESKYLPIPSTTDKHGWKLISGSNNGHEYVDLGLPSGTLWATCNIGATAPEEYGGYFAWGETEEKYYYDESTYKCQYNGNDIARTKYDVAHMKWGGSWRMPSHEQIKELIDNCTRTLTEQNGTIGTLVKGLNGATIFMPSAGLRSQDIDYYLNEGHYWSSSIIHPFDEDYVSILVLYNNNWELTQGYRDEGYSVRAVCESSPSFSLSQYFITPKIGQKIVIDIIYGSGNYSISNDNSYIAKGALSSSQIMIETLHAGSTTITVEDLGLNQKEIIYVETQDIPIADAIDLGLPSGTKWASWNVGASAPEEYGGYYAWGETEEKDYYTWNTYKYCNGSEESCYNIGEDIAGTDYDVAHVKFGGSWQMPSLVQFKELCEICSWNWTTQNGVNGQLITGPNGNQIFMPAAGCRIYDRIETDGPTGYYWSSSLVPNNELCSYYLCLDYWGAILWDKTERFRGLPVRAVCP